MSDYQEYGNTRQIQRIDRRALLDLRTALAVRLAQLGVIGIRQTTTRAMAISIAVRICSTCVVSSVPGQTYAATANWANEKLMSAIEAIHPRHFRLLPACESV